MVIQIKKQKVSTLIIIDLLCICFGFGLFCLFHFVIDLSEDPEPVSLLAADSSATLPDPDPDLSGSPAGDGSTPENEAESSGSETDRTVSGMFGQQFADKFTDGEIIRTEDTYRSRNLSVSVSHITENGIIYNIADIYIRDLKYLKTALGGDGFKKSTEMLADIAERHGAVVAISGDHYGARAKGVVVRNGILYRNTGFEDIGIITNKGELITVPASEYNPDALAGYGAWQAWCFGPELLDSGNVKTSFNSNVKRANPRSAIGCVEPGHYYFVEVDGRTAASAGMTMEQLSNLFYDLGCVSAYNLDGGQTSGFWWNGSLLSYPYGRPVWDMIYIGEDE